MNGRRDVQITGRGGVFLGRVGQCKVVGGRRLQVDNHRVRAAIGVCGNDRTAQTAIVVCVCTGRSGGRIVRPIDIKRCR